MLFNSYIFIFIFLPVVWTVYYGLNKLKKYRLAVSFLTMASIFFYGYGNWWYVALLAAGILLNYGLYSLLQTQNSCRFSILMLGILYNLGFLFYFKYYNFFLENFNLVFKTTLPLKNILLPLGISFYTFQQISFLIDSYRGDMRQYSFMEYALFVSFFPQLIAGPIVLHSEMIPQFCDKEKRVVNYDSVYEGLQYFTFGLTKKLLLADTLGRIVDWGYENVLSLNTLGAAVLILSYTLQIFLDFSGYSDMAIGIGRLFGFELPANFNSPYKAYSVGEFWKRWHMTLTRFLTTYLYIPLGGNRKGKVRTCIHIMIVFLVSGFWHGADWTFVLWGGLHGCMMVAERLCGKQLERIPKVLRRVGTFCFVNMAWVFFRADFFRQALSVFKHLSFGGFGGIPEGMCNAFLGSGAKLFWGQLQSVPTAGSLFVQGMLLLWLSALLCMLIYGKSTQELVAKRKEEKGYVFALSCLLLASVVSLSSVSQFLYFNF